LASIFLNQHIILSLDNQNTLFIQKWEFNGILTPIFRKQIFKELVVFDTMNIELKTMLEN